MAFKDKWLHHTGVTAWDIHIECDMSTPLTCYPGLLQQSTKYVVALSNSLVEAGNLSHDVGRGMSALKACGGRISPCLFHLAVICSILVCHFRGFTRASFHLCLHLHITFFCRCGKSLSLLMIPIVGVEYLQKPRGIWSLISNFIASGKSYFQIFLITVIELGYGYSFRRTHSSST